MINIGDVNTKVYIGDTEAKVYIGDELIYPTGQHDYSQDYLTFKITASGNIRLMNIKNYSQARKTIQYSKDGGTTWTSVTSSDGSDSSPFTGATLIPVVAGEVLLFKGNYVSYGSSNYYTAFEGSDAGFEVCGNIMSMVSGDNFTTATALTDTRNFRNFFSKCSGLTSAENLVLPSNVVTECYAWMFQDDISLTTAPVLPARSGDYRCYHAMFNRSSSLNYVKCLLTSGMTNIGTNWLNAVSSTGTFVKATGVSWNTGASAIPSGWTVLEE